MEKRIKIKHDGPRGWATIAKSGFDPAKHERYEEHKPRPATSAAIEVLADAEAQAARMKLKPQQIEAMDRDELRQNLDGMGVGFRPQHKEPKLREMLSSAIAKAG